MEIKPYIGVGELLFSDNREQTRAKLNFPFKSGVKEFEEVSEPYDYYHDAGFFIYFDKADNVNAIEIFDHDLTFNNTLISQLAYNDLVKFFMKLDNDLIVEYSNFISLKLGIGGNTNDDPDTDDALTEAIIIFREGYFDGILT